MFKVKEAHPSDAHKGVARMDPADMAVLGLSEGQIVVIEGKKMRAQKTPSPVFGPVRRNFAENAFCRSTV